MREIKIIKCPELNKSLRNRCSNGSPDLEVAVLYNDNARPEAIMCDNYKSGGDSECSLKEKGGKCTYSAWKNFQVKKENVGEPC